MIRHAFPVLAWGLAFHSLVITILFGFFGLSADLVRAIAGWRDLALCYLLAYVLIRALTGRSSPVEIVWTDYWVGALFTLAVLFLVGEDAWLRTSLPTQVELMGLRQSVFFMLIYFVGRATPQLAEDDSAMRQIFLLLVVTCVIGILERFLIPPEGLVALGVASYFQTFLGASVMTAGNAYGLPQNYWAVVGGHEVRRAGSIYLGGQGFAIPFLLFFPMATAWVIGKARRTGWQIAGYVIVCVAFLLTLTRMTIVVGVIQLVLFVVLRRRAEWAVGAFAVGGMLFVVAMLLMPGFPMFVWYTLTGQEISTASHVNDLWNGTIAILQQPWGYGLGTADAAAARAGLMHITGDNLFLTYGVQFGVIGLLLLILILGSILGHALALLRQGATDGQRRMGMAMTLATIGLLINGMTAVVFNSIVFGWLYFWLAGSVVTLSQRGRGESAAPRRVELTAIA